MVKADVRCDYYADLELPPAATADEIKKQFKKLGKIPLLDGGFYKSLKPRYT